MSEVRVQNAFGVKGLELAAVGDVDNLLAPLANPADELELKVAAGTSSGAIGLFDQAFQVSGEAGAKLLLKVHKANGPAKDAFGVDTAPGSHQRWCELAIEGRLRASASDTASSGPFRFSASASASSELEYRRFFPVPAQTPLTDIATQALLGARFPGRFFDRQLLPGEWHRFVGRLRFGLDLSGGAGFETSQYQDVVELFQDFSPEIRATAQATVSAALGFSLFESTEIVVHRPIDGSEDRMRLRLARVHDRGLTFGAKVALGLQTNLGTVLNQTLDHVFALEPVADVFDAWKEIAAFGSAQGWQQLQSKVTKKAADTVLGLFQRYAGLQTSATVDGLIGAVASWLKKWDSLDGVLKDLWADLLEHGGPGSDPALRELLGKVTELRGAGDRSQALARIVALKNDADGRPFLSLIELLSGETLESLISSPEEGALAAALDRVAKMAQDALDQMNAGPVPVLRALDQFAKESGIAAVVAKLRHHLGSATNLREAIESPLRKVVERLFGKAWEQLEKSELARLRTWAKKVDAELKDFQKWETKLRADLKRLDERFGLSLSFELSRQFHQEAFLDVDLCDRIWEKAAIRDELRNGDLPAVIRRLAEAATAEDTDDAIEIRECAFLTRRIRSSAWGLMVEALGFKLVREVGSLRTLQKVERITGCGTTVELRGASERFSKTQSGSNKEAWRSKAELELTAALAGKNFAPEVAKVVLEVSLEDDKMLEGERKAIDHLLAHLGLVAIEGQASAPVCQPFVRFSVTVQFSGAPVALLGALAKAAERKGVLAEVERLYRDELVGADEAAFEPGLRAGDVMARLLRDSGFLEALRDPQAVLDFLRTHTATVQGRSLDLFDNLGCRPKAAVGSLASLPAAMNGRWPALAKKTAKVLAGASGKKEIEAWEKLTHAFVAQHKALVLDGYSINPMLGFYVFFALLAQAPGVSLHAAASLQVKEENAGGAWSVPKLWHR